MKYQDLKIRDAGRLAMIGLAVAAAIAVLVGARGAVEPLLGRRYVSTLWGLIVLLPLMWGVAAVYLFTSPAQDARFLAWAQKRGHKPSAKFDPSLLDPSDPDYQVMTLSYILARRRGR